MVGGVGGGGVSEGFDGDGLGECRGALGLEAGVAGDAVEERVDVGAVEDVEELGEREVVALGDVDEVDVGAVVVGEEGVEGFGGEGGVSG